MKNSTSGIFSTLSATALLIMGSLLVSCSNPADSDDDHEEHESPVGVVLRMNEQDIVSFEEGDLTGQIEVNEGEETTRITIFFLADDGDEFQPDESEYELRWVVGNEDVAEVEQHSEDGAWSFHVAGITSGDTDVVLMLFHTEEGHSDFDTPGIPIVVN